MQKQRLSRNSVRWRKTSASTCYRQKKKTSNRNKKDEAKKQEKEALNSLEINFFLKKSDNYLGTFSSDQLNRLVIHSFPCFLIVNTAPKSESFGHWIALRISNLSIEVFDSLGGNPKTWGPQASQLVQFIKFYSRRKTIFVSPVLQNSYSQLCGYFTIYFVLARKYLSFSQTVSPFSTDLSLNDSIICDLLLDLL